MKERLKKAAIIAAAILTAMFLLAGFAWGYSCFYSGKVYGGVYLNHYHLGGLTAAEVKDFIENFNNRLAKEGLDFYFIGQDGERKKIKLNAVSTDDSSVELASVNGARAGDSALAAGRSGPWWRGLFEPLVFIFMNKHLDTPLAVEDKLMAQLKNNLSAQITPSADANVKITSVTPLAYEIETEKGGAIFDYELAAKEINARLASLSLAPIEVKQTAFSPEVTKEDAARIAGNIPAILSYGSLNLNYIEPQTKIRRDWVVAVDTYVGWMEVRRVDGQFVFALNKEKVFQYLDATIRPLIDSQAKDAKFVMENDKVREFQASESGINLNGEKTYNELDALFRERNYNPANPARTLTVSTDIIEPAIKVSDVNNLGIIDLIGSGVSTFRDSHTNRIKNIATAVKRLNGVLVAPGEEFSAIKYAGPFTSANGFLPEAVIKGKEIKNEIGGGMCQIGTTLFRMAMNSAMPITRRRNHSLVVGYYADPVNGNPGTDATLYEPDTDFRFINDTGGYLLLQTEISYVKQRLVFSLWGKSDGRKGWYTHPVVSRWIPAGEPQEVISDKLKPGEKNCQNAFRGAVASFTYSRITSSSEQIDRVFESYYRPLPRICMIGVDSASSTPEGEELPTTTAVE